MPSTRRSSAQQQPESELAGPSRASTSLSKPRTSSAASSKAASKDKASSTASAAAPAREDDIPSTDDNIELLTEHLGFNPRAYIDALAYAANEHLYAIGDRFEDFARTQLAGKGKDGQEGGPDDSVDATDLEAEQGVHAILTLLENALDHTFDTLELYTLRSIFGLTPRQARAVTLPHHRGLDLRPASERGGDAGKESQRLSERERELRAKIRAARATQHALTLANAASAQRLARLSLLHETFSVLLRRPDSCTPAERDASGPGNVRLALAQTLGPAAVQLTSDASKLVDALAELRARDPLGAALIPPAKFNASGSGAGPGAGAGGEGAGVGAGEEGTRAWERGREAYLTWEAERGVASAKARGKSAVHDGSPVIDVANEGAGAGVGEAIPKKGGRKRKSGPGSSSVGNGNGSAGNSRKRATSGTASPAHADAEAEAEAEAEEEKVGAPQTVVGDAAQMENLASLLRAPTE